MKSALGQIYSIQKSHGLAITADNVGIDTNEMSATAIISTPTWDRQNDSVDPMGVCLKNYAINPVVYFDHGQDITQPIARAEDNEGNLQVFPSDLGITSKSYFSKNNQVSSQFFHLVADRILRGTSIRFSPLVAPIRKGDRSRFNKTTLEEWSWTGLGVNPECVQGVIAKGMLDSTPIEPSVMKSLRALAPPVSPHGTKKSRNNSTVTFTGSMKPDLLESYMQRKVLGQQVMEAGHAKLSALRSELKSALLLVENNKVNDVMATVLKSLDDASTTIKGGFAEAYPSAKLKAMDMDEDMDDMDDGEKAYEKMMADEEYMKMYSDDDRQKMMDDSEYRAEMVKMYREKMADMTEENRVKSFLAINDKHRWDTTGLVANLNEIAEADDLPERYKSALGNYAKSLSSIVKSAMEYKPSEQNEPKIEDNPKYKSLAATLVNLEAKIKDMAPAQRR